MMSAVGAMQTARHDQPMVSAASYPPLQKTQGRGTHSSGTGKTTRGTLGHPPSTRKRLVTYGLVLLLFATLGVKGQTENQLKTRLKTVTAFEIRPAINVFPAFAKDGNVCRMVVEKRRFSDPADADPEATIPNALANQLVDELVPASERGKALSPYLSSESFVAGGASFIKKDYENVSVAMFGSLVEGKASGTRVIVINWSRRTCLSR
jgi:hypothetical protein